FLCVCVLCRSFFLININLCNHSWIHGDPRKVVYPTDSHGQFCGQKNTPNANKAILFYFNMLKCANPAVLINLQCPTTQVGLFLHDVLLLPALYEDCPSMIVPSRPFLQRCFPDFITRNGTLTVANQTIFKDGQNNKRSVKDLKEAATGISSLLNAKEVGMKIFEDYANSWYWILIGLLITMAASLVFILLLRYTAGALLWIIIFGVITAVAYGIWHCYSEYRALSKKSGANMTISDISIHTDFSIYLQLSQTWFIFMISLCVIEAIIVLILIFLRTRLCIAVALLKEGSKAISYIMSTLFYPIITFLLLAICITYWAMTAVFLASSGNAVYKVTPSDDNCMYANLTCNPKTFNQTNITKVCPGSQCLFAFYGGESVYHRYIIVLHLCNLFVFLWLVNFTIALGQCTLAGSFASYYWALNKPDDIPACPLYASFSRAIRYHTGSLAFGSLILAMVQMVRIVLEYMDHKLKGSQNACARYFLCCLKCCFWCLEHFIKFINRNAYIMVSCKTSALPIVSTGLLVAVLDKVTDFLLFLGKLLISGSVGVLAFMFFTKKIPVIQEEVPSLNYYWVPLVTVIFGSYMIAHGFFNVFAMCVDTLFLCFCEDLERNDGSSSRPYYMSPSLHKILRKGEEGAKSSAAS
uniref:Choline transporter-like protein n=1 Tax=Mastacembelus armatus TaxID=205130 RepID=A0A7N8XRN7_9TELE